MFRYKLRTLLILLAVLPPMVAWLVYYLWLISQPQGIKGLTP
jgi:hypothetical protein